jgi:quinol monooxygenase YgiN
MVIIAVSFVAAAGKNAQALEYLHKVAAGTKARSSTEMRVLTAILGPANHYMLVSEYESLSAWDAARSRAHRDESLQKMMVAAAGDGLFVPGSVVRTAWEQV